MAEPTRGEVEAALANAITQFEKEQMGRGPVETRVYIIEDMILVSVDDHVVEPPDLFEGRLSSQYVDVAPRVITKDDGTDVWLFEGQELPNIGLNAVSGRPVEEYGIEPTAFANFFASRIPRSPCQRTISASSLRVIGGSTSSPASRSRISFRS